MLFLYHIPQWYVKIPLASCRLVKAMGDTDHHLCADWSVIRVSGLLAPGALHWLTVDFGVMDRHDGVGGGFLRRKPVNKNYITFIRFFFSLKNYSVKLTI